MLLPFVSRSPPNCGVVSSTTALIPPPATAAANEADTFVNPGIDNVEDIPKLPVIWESPWLISPFLAINSFARLFLFHFPKVRV